MLRAAVRTRAGHDKKQLRYAEIGLNAPHASRDQASIDERERR
jgi:hypothetical protein